MTSWQSQRPTIWKESSAPTLPPKKISIGPSTGWNACSVDAVGSGAPSGERAFDAMKVVPPNGVELVFLQNEANILLDYQPFMKSRLAATDKPSGPQSPPRQATLSRNGSAELAKVATHGEAPKACG